MTKKYNQSITVLAFCSALIDFLVATPSDILYPRDRIIHIIISAAGFMLIAYLIDIFNSDSVFFRLIAFLMLSAKIIFFSYRFSGYFRIFYGNSTFGIIIFTVVVFIMAVNIKDKNFSQFGGFYIFANSALFVLLFISAKSMDAINIYSVKRTFEFSAEKLFLFFDILTIAVISGDRKTKWQNQKRFIIFSAVVFILITVIQGLSIKGDLLYRLSPLQSLLQIFSGNTVRRYDYIFNLFFTFNYFGAVIMYSAALKKILNPENNFEKN